MASKKLPAYSSFDVSPASLKSSGAISTGKYKGLPRPTAMSQTLSLHLAGGGMQMFHSYKDGYGKYTWRTAQNASGGSRAANGFIAFRSAVLKELSGAGIHLSTKGALSGRNVHQRVLAEYVSRRQLHGNLESKAVYAGALRWVESQEGRNYVTGALVSEIRRLQGQGKVVLTTGAKSKVINVDQIKAGNFPLSPKNKSKRSWMQISGEGMSLGGSRRNGATASASQSHIQNQVSNIVDTAENLAAEVGASFNPGPGRGAGSGRRRRSGSQSSL